MELKVHTVYSGEISELCWHYPSLSFLEHVSVPKTEQNKWLINNPHWGYADKPVYDARVMFIGKTGYGKSTTLNRIIGHKAFETNDISICTKDLYEATYRIDEKGDSFFSLCDLPGIGESDYADNHYYGWYREMLKKSHCVVYILRADQRDYTMDGILFSQMFRNRSDLWKVILALNFADKIEPLNRHSADLSKEQLEHLSAKIDSISQIFQMPKDSILYYSAMDGLNIDILIGHIAEKIYEELIRRNNHGMGYWGAFDSKEPISAIARNAISLAVFILSPYCSSMISGNKGLEAETASVLEKLYNGDTLNIESAKKLVRISHKAGDSLDTAFAKLYASLQYNDKMQFHFIVKQIFDSAQQDIMSEKVPDYVKMNGNVYAENYYKLSTITES